LKQARQADSRVQCLMQSCSERAAEHCKLRIKQASNSRPSPVHGFVDSYRLVLCFRLMKWPKWPCAF